jgi:hypothetical protein
MIGETLTLPQTINPMPLILTFTVNDWLGITMLIDVSSGQLSEPYCADEYWNKNDPTFDEPRLTFETLREAPV